MKKMPLQFGRMAHVAMEYCAFIDNLDDVNADRQWVSRMEKLLPRLHVAIIALVMPGGDGCCAYHFYDDDQRCELYMRLHHVLQSDASLWSAYEGARFQSRVRQKLCARMADNFTDMYFDLKCGLDLLEDDQGQAVNNWLCSFYVHWGQHLLDAECCLYAAETGGKLPPLFMRPLSMHMPMQLSVQNGPQILDATQA